ncbi:hypothetical protein [Nesterenkonia pannonica]|uniref:hypothetical protein n=1 Tax=Nesterenkonia pannonica TaxID=1548602 RepID=UPI0021647B12|nr:hypothetical protein [Nesterenkonia pannonica]
MVARLGSDVAENSGRWVKLTNESAKAMKANGLMPTGQHGVSHAMVGKSGEIKQWLQVVNKAPALVGGPMALAAVAAMMQQRAMQQQMDEIVGYLQQIDAKVEEVLNAQKDTVLADMTSVESVLRKAFNVREGSGQVSTSRGRSCRVLSRPSTAPGITQYVS